MRAPSCSLYMCIVENGPAGMWELCLAVSAPLWWPDPVLGRCPKVLKDSGLGVMPQLFFLFLFGFALHVYTQRTQNLMKN